MLDTLAQSDFSLHIFPPVKHGSDWYGSGVLKIGPHEVKFMAAANEGLLRQAYELAARHISYGPDVAGCEGCSPVNATTFVGQLADLAPYVPTQGLAPYAQQACTLILRAANGCASCVDKLNHINELAAQGNKTAKEAKTIVNGLLSMAMVRRGAVKRIARMNPGEFDSFLRALQ